MGQERVGESGRGRQHNYQYNFWKTSIIRGNFEAIKFSIMFPSPTNNIIHKIQYVYIYTNILYICGSRLNRLNAHSV